jgi:3D (Asp-Asp-Asp) domain-containing protein
MRPYRASICLWGIMVSCTAAEPTPKSPETIRLGITRDTWFSEVGREAEGNTGGADRLKVKSIQEMSLVDFDPAPLRGRLVGSATLHLRVRGAETLRRMTIGSFSADWTEGTATGYEPQKGSSCFNWRQYPDVPWAYRGSDLCEVIFGRGGSRWQTTDASSVGQDGWQTMAVDPRVIAARVANCSYGLFVFDDTGSEWSRDGERFELRLFPNRFIYSREAGERNVPYLTVELGQADSEPPEAPAGIELESRRMPSGEVRVSWLTPKDRGPGETIGYQIKLDSQPLPRYLIPIAPAAGERTVMHLRDVPISDGATLAISAVDSAGNEGPPAEVRLAVAGAATPVLPSRPATREAASRSLPKLAGAEIAVIDELDKVNLATDQLVPAHPDSYLVDNHLWNAEEREVRLHAAKNESVGFQLLAKGRVTGFNVQTAFLGNQTAFQIEWHRLSAVRVGQGAFVDAVLPMKDSAIDLPDERQTVSGMRRRSPISTMHCEIYVPHDAKAGEYVGEVLLGAKDQPPLSLKLRLTVWDFTLPDYLSFLPEMNCYGLPENERDYYRLLISTARF